MAWMRICNVNFFSLLCSTKKLSNHAWIQNIKYKFDKNLNYFSYNVMKMCWDARPENRSSFHTLSTKLRELLQFTEVKFTDLLSIVSCPPGNLDGADVLYLCYNVLIIHQANNDYVNLSIDENGSKSTEQKGEQNSFDKLAADDADDEYEYVN